MHIPNRIIDEARERLRILLGDPDSLEEEWQRLFAECPIILSGSLPLYLHPRDIIPAGRNGQAEADFYIYPRNPDPNSAYGIIELKRPNTRLITIPRKDVLCLSANANNAICQARKYAREFKQELECRDENLFLFGNDLHVVIIAGLYSREIEKLTNSNLKSQMNDLFLKGCRIIPYDNLAMSFEKRFPPRIHVLCDFSPGTKLYVGNLSYDTDDNSLFKHFSRFGLVERAEVQTDKMSGRSKGFGFVEFAQSQSVSEAIEHTNRSGLDGREVRVNLARPLETVLDGIIERASIAYPSPQRDQRS